MRGRLLRSLKLGSEPMKGKLLEIIRRLLETDADLSFLVQLSEEELGTLIACIRSRLDSPKA
jgi:hypothetical protein